MSKSEKSGYSSGCSKTLHFVFGPETPLNRQISASASKTMPIFLKPVEWSWRTSWSKSRENRKILKFPNLCNGKFNGISIFLFIKKVKIMRKLLFLKCFLINQDTEILENPFKTIGNIREMYFGLWKISL